MRIHELRKRARTRTTKPSLTDQSQAKATDINVIVKSMLRGSQPTSSAHPIYGDFSNLPQDLRAMIEQTRSIEKLRKSLPQQLRERPIEELLSLTPDELANILQPPAPAPATPPAPPPA